MYKIGINDSVRDKLLKHLEESGSFSPSAYLDTEHLPTIGWGNRFHLDGREVKMGDTISREDADKLYNREITRHVEALRKTKNYNKFNPNQQAALESFAYNAGPYFLDSEGYKTISAAIKSGDIEGVKRALPMYRNGGVLDNRRRQELELFNTPWSDPQPKPKPTAAKKTTKSPAIKLSIKDILPPSILNLKINR